MTREAIRIAQPDGSIKVVFREVNSNLRKDEKKNDDKKQIMDKEKGRYYNPLNENHIDIFGKDLLNRHLVITMYNGETIPCVMLGYAMYEILVEYNNHKVILMKQWIEKIEVQ